MTAAIDRERIDEPLVRDLLAEQFPHWADLPVRLVRNGGNDHQIFRVGDDLSVRLPAAADFVTQVRKEQAWLPRLAPCLPLPIPSVAGIGEPSDLFPAPWSVYDWKGAVEGADHDHEQAAGPGGVRPQCARPALRGGMKNRPKLVSIK